MGTGQNGTVAVVLEEQSRKFAYDKTRAVKGTLQIKQRIETEVELRVENLRPDTYKLFFIGRNEGNSVYRIIGDVIPDKSGTGRLHAVVDPEDIDGQGNGLSCFYIFIIAAPGTPLMPVLKGDRTDRKTSYRKDYNSYYSEYIKEMAGRLVKRKNEFYDISPFDDEWMSDDWKRVQEVMELPVASVGARKQCKKYGHFLFAHEGNILFLAVPGRHDESEWPDKGASGFLMWQPIRDSREYGYWCMIIDLKAGIVTEIS